MAQAPSKPPEQKTSKAEPMSPFELMHRYRMPILLTCLLTLFGFGVWAALADWFGLGARAGEDRNKVVASYELGGKKYDVTMAEFYGAVGDRGIADMEKSAPVILASIIRQKMVELVDAFVSPQEAKDALTDQIVDPLKERNDGKFDQAQYAQYVNIGYRMTVQDYERELQRSMGEVKVAREIDRAADDMTTAKIFEQYKKQFPKLKLKGVFFSSAVYETAAKLATEKVDGKDVLTAEAKTKLEEWWKKLDDGKKRTFAKGGPLLSADAIGFRFSGRTDAEFDQEFNRENVVSKTSLAKLTEAYAPTNDDLTKLKMRFTRYRDAYGVTADADVEKLFEEHKNRLIQEWKVLKLLKKIHDDIAAALAAKTEPNLKELADKSNLAFFSVVNMKLDELVKHPDYPGFWANQLSMLNAGDLLTIPAPVTPDSHAFETAIVDEVGKHGSIWRLTGKDPNPPVVLIDVMDEAKKRYEEDEAKALRDAAFKAFEDKMDAWLNEKVKTVADAAKAEAQTAIAEETKGLDPEKDKAKIEAIKTQKDAEANVKISTEKAKFRSEAFEEACKDPAVATLVVEEGFFKPQSAMLESIVDKDAGSLEQKARSSLRRDFRTLQDNAFTDTYVETGTVSAAVESPTYPGLKGMAKLVEKKAATIQDMFANPREMQQAEYQVLNKSRQAMQQGGGGWTLESLKKYMKLECAWIDEQIDKEKKAARESEEAAQRDEAERQKRIDAAKRAQQPTTLPTNPQGTPPK